MNEYLLFALALIPIAGLMLSLGLFKWPAHVATPLAWVAAGLLAFLFWNTDVVHLGLASLEGGLFALWPIMIVIVAAIFTYKLAEMTGALDTIKKILAGITQDRRIQVLILAWGFGGFLEAVAGYGTAVAIPASILAILGFNPLFAAVVSLIANTVPTAFGAVGIPVTTLASVAGLDPGPLSLAVAAQLTPFIILVPFALVIITGGGFKAVKGVFGVTLAAGLAFALPQLAAAAFLGPELPALLGSLCSLVVTIFYTKLFHKGPETSGETVSFRQGFLAWLPYILVFLLVLLASKVFPPIYHLLNQAHSSFNIYPGGAPLEFKWINTPGVLIIIAAVAGTLIQGAKTSAIVKTFGKTLWTLNKSTVTVVFILAMAKIMEHAGMTTAVATVLTQVSGAFYPFFAPLMGSLGTFVTGSDTSSNILFGSLQVQVAQGVHASPYWLAAANTAGATAGKMISPQSIAVATSATNLTGQEGKILGRTLGFCVGYALILGLLVILVGPLVRGWFPA